MLEPLRRQARSLFDIGVKAASPGLAVRRNLQPRAQTVIDVPGKIGIFGIGKASPAMMEAALEIVPDSKRAFALVLTTYENERPVPGATVVSGNHPTPDEAGMRATQEILKLAGALGRDDKALVLISGGGSALTPAPRSPLSLADKIRVNEVLLASGLGIEEMNLIRQSLSEFKGGRLARAIAPAQTEAFILSDVIGNDLRAIASGPTAAPLGSCQDAKKILQDHGAWEAMPSSVQTLLNRDVEDETLDLSRVTNHLIASNKQSLEVMIEAVGEKGHLCSGGLVGDVEEVAKTIVADATNPALAEKKILIWGGEPTVKIQGSGKGGRNQELALRVANHMPQSSQSWAFLSGGTDGRDGPTDAAGGLVTPKTVGVLGQSRIDAFLRKNDSYHALKESDDLLICGATGTNVADLMILCR